MVIKAHIKTWCKQWLCIEHLYSKYASEYGLTLASLHILDRLYHDTQCTQKALREYTSLPKQTVSSSMKQLEKQLLIIWSCSTEDRRLREYQLSELGRALCKKVFERLDQIEYQAFRSLSCNDREHLLRINQQLNMEIQQGMCGGKANGNKS